MNFFMDKSETSTEGKKKLSVSRENIDNLLEKYFDTLEKEGYGRVNLDCMTFNVPEKQKQGEEIQEVNPKLTSLLKDPIDYKKVSAIGNKTKSNEKAYNKKRVSAKKESSKRQKETNIKNSPEKDTDREMI